MYSAEEREAFVDEFRFGRFFSAEEITPEQIEILAEDNGLAYNRNEQGSWIANDLGCIDCIVNEKKINAKVVISYKNRCIYVRPNIMRMETWYKLDYSNKPFNVSSDLEAKSISVDGIKLFINLTGPIKILIYNNILFSFKYADALWSSGEAIVCEETGKEVKPFYIDNRIRLTYSVEVNSAYSRSIATQESMSMDIRGVRFTKYNEYSDVETGGTADFHCVLPTVNEFTEIMKEQATWIESVPYEEALVLSSDHYSPIYAKITSSVYVDKYWLVPDEGKSRRKEFYIREDLYECKYFFGSPENRTLYLFMDESRTAGIQFDFQDMRQYYSFGEYLQILRSNYSSAKKNILTLIDELNSNNRNGKKCPVCGTYNQNGVTYCRACLFDQLDPEFISREDAENWKETVVKPYRESYSRIR